MFGRRIGSPRGQLGSLLGGLSLAALGVFQFRQASVGIPWSERWPLFLVAPGLALVFRSRLRPEVSGNQTA